MFRDSSEIGNLVAEEMDGILSSKEYADLFKKASDEVDDESEEENEELELTHKQHNINIVYEPKEDKKEANIQDIIYTLSKISGQLDSIGLTNTATAVIEAMDSILAEAAGEDQPDTSEYLNNLSKALEENPPLEEMVEEEVADEVADEVEEDEVEFLRAVREFARAYRAQHPDKKGLFGVPDPEPELPEEDPVLNEDMYEDPVLNEDMYKDLSEELSQDAVQDLEDLELPVELKESHQLNFLIKKYASAMEDAEETDTLSVDDDLIDQFLSDNDETFDDED